MDIDKEKLVSRIVRIMIKSHSEEENRDELNRLITAIHTGELDKESCEVCNGTFANRMFVYCARCGRKLPNKGDK